MNRKLLLVLALMLCAAVLEAAFDTYAPDGGAVSRIEAEGSATMHGWAMEARRIKGRLELDETFPLDARSARARAMGGPVLARGRVIIDLNDLKSVRNGKHFSTRMDNQMYAALNKQTHPTIEYELDKALLKGVSSAAAGALQFETRGRLTVAGQTREIGMPVELLVLADGRLRISGTAALKMSDFGVEPPSMALIKVADAVDVRFEWFVRPAE